MAETATEQDKAAEEVAGAEADAGGSYEVLKDRLAAQGRELGQRAETLNERRKATFGGTELAVIGTERVRTENNCIPAEIISIGDLLLFGYTVHLGLKKTADVEDVFSLHKFEATDDGFDFSSVSFDHAGGFLQDSTFVRELNELYQFYKDPYLLLLQMTPDFKLLAVFRVGEAATDTKVFRWSVDQSGRAFYIDSRGERDHVFPPSHDFKWLTPEQQDHVRGRHPHISILDEVFVETIGGDLTIKVENNTEDGLGIYNEPVQEKNQSLDDAEISYAKLGGLLLLKILPYREEEYRYFVFNMRNQEVVRIDDIGKACVQLPEDHGIIFPGGYYLQTGVYKLFEGDRGDLEFQQAVRSPNGEDVLYVFLTRNDGNYVLFPYNMIRKEVQNPIPCHGYTIFPDGKMVLFRQVSDEPTRVHPMQIWQTPFTSAEFAASAPTDGSFLSKVGNAELVRGISDAYSVRRLTIDQKPVRHIYEDMISASQRMLDTYYWLENEEVGDLTSVVKEVRDTAELIIDEFEKIQALRDRARESLKETKERQHEIIRDLRPEDWREIEKFMDALRALRNQRGRLITLRDLRFMDTEAVDELEAEVVEQFDRVSAGCVEFLLTDEAFDPLTAQLDELLEQIQAVEKTTEVEPLTEELTRINEGLDVLSEVASGLQVADPTARTKILEGISEVFAHVNRVRATLEVKRKELLGREGRAEFAAQFKLLGQSVDSAISRADTPETCDDALSQLMLQLEEIESKFSEFDEFLGELAAKREEIYEALSAKKQTLVEERQRRAQNLFDAATRILGGVGRRARTFKTEDDLNAYFSSDPMLLKLRDLVERLNELGDSVKADEVESRLKSARQDALRVLRDRTELFEEGENVIKFGRHRFSVNTQPLEMTMVPRGEGMSLHLTGTDFHEQVVDETFLATRDLWGMSVASESTTVYRGEYLAASILFDAEQQQSGMSLERLQAAALDEGKGMLTLVRQYAGNRYDEGYERGVHDADAARILEKLLSLRQSAGMLRFAPTPRSLACLFWACIEDDQERTRLKRKARSLGLLRSTFHFSPAIAKLGQELAAAIREFTLDAGLSASEGDLRVAGQYLVEELMAADPPTFTSSTEAESLRDALLEKLDEDMVRASFEDDLRSLEDRPAEAYALADAWFGAFLSTSEEMQRLSYVQAEAAVLLITERRLSRQSTAALSSVEVDGLLGQHANIDNGTLELRLDEFLDRLSEHVHSVVPRYREYRKLRAEVIERERAALRLDEFKPRVLTSFVRNRLINEVYLPLIGDNLAKQLGSVGESKRTDLMGLLLLVSPPGYGKTTLMEYLASQLGLVFMKVNGPSLGHSVSSLDPSEAPNATARQEVNKINLAFEMGNNVMLYLDDIQHTNPELLQKFISLCDAQRRIEGVWKGRTRTYDLRGKKFCMVMAGNPYTESGERFQIPDMLSNRADTYNLGDVLDGKEHLFALSYVENALTSNPTLSPLASRAQKDLYLLIRMAQGEDVPTTELSHDYGAADMSDMIKVLKHLFSVQKVLLQVNSQYIYSAAQDDAYRTEPPFQLQGSYRNMTKMAEKVVSAMNEAELQRLIDDHYLGEAQTLTSGAEQNLLKLKELRGTLAGDELSRWEQIKKEFQRLKRLGGSEDDPAVRVVSQLGDIGERLDEIRQGVAAATTGEPSAVERGLNATLTRLDAAMDKLQHPEVQISVDNEVPPPMARMLDQQVALVEGLLNMIYSTTRSLEEGGAIHIQLTAVLNDMRGIVEKLRELPKTSTPKAKKPPPEHRPVPTTTSAAPKTPAATPSRTKAPTTQPASSAEASKPGGWSGFDDLKRKAEQARQARAKRIAETSGGEDRSVPSPKDLHEPPPEGENS